MNASSGNLANSTTTTSASVLPPKTFIMNGNWNLVVDNGSVISFDARFTKVELDASNRHTHEITNFTSSNNSPIDAGISGTTTIIIGTTDVAINNVTMWHNVKTTIIMNNLSALTISLDPAGTANHSMLNQSTEL